ncbi:MAG: metallophosphoesterase [Cyclobacterium sp.]|uniref:metallophosphoesterase family protein n=1 Tax=Cyclobacterium sp. TaxID=1966343 RepID=UPI003970EA34
MNFRSGHLWAVVLMLACQPDPETPTYREAFLEDQQKVSGFFQLQFPKDKLTALDSGWVFLGLDSLTGIHREWPTRFSLSDPVSLPHRLPVPNHSLWYRWEGNLEPGILLVNADDGVQCWINQKQIPRAAEGDYFEVDAYGQTELGLRVVNNAMGGGLRGVQFLPQAAHQSWQEKKTQIRKAVLADRKIELLQDPDHVRKCGELSFPELTERLSAYPILFTVPVLIWSTDGKPFVRWVSESADKATLRLDNGEEISIASTDGVFTYELDPGTGFSFDLYQEKSYQGHYSLKARPNTKDIKLALWGDSQGGWDTFRKVADAIRAHEADLSIGAGDLVNNGSEDWAYPRFLQLLSRMHTPQLLVPGNHDYDGHYDDLVARQLKQYLAQPQTPTYGLHQFGPVAILSLDPNVNFPVSVPAGTRQRDWLEKQLESDTWRSAPWKIIVLHQPPYAQGWSGYQGEWTIRQLLEPYFHRGLVDLVVAGHTHDYERLSLDFSGHPVHFLVVGGAGGGLEPEGEQSDFPRMDRLIKKHHYGILEINSSRMHFTAYDLEGNTMDTLSIEK